MAVMRHKPLIGRRNSGKTMALMARRIKAYNRPNIAAPADKALRKPAFIALMTHGACAVAERSGLTDDEERADDSRSGTGG
jgi:hypothetical protein